jgi:hypothetical protein
MRKLWLLVCLICGVLLLGCTLLVPAHFRAVDAAVIERAGKGGRGMSATLVEEGATFLSVEKLGPAHMLARVAQAEGVPRNELLISGIAQFTRENPSLVALGGATPVLEKIEITQGKVTEPQPIVDLLSRRVAREKAMAIAQQSRRPGVQQILKNRTLTNTVHFPSAMTSAGQALDAAIVTAALLYQGDYLTPAFRDAFEWLAMCANRGDDSGSLELVYLDLLSLGRRLDWVSLTELMKRVDDIATLRDIAEAVRSREETTPQIFSAVVLAENAGKVAKYLARYPETGLNDLSFALRNGRGAVELLVKQQQRVYYAGLRKKVVSYDPFGAFFHTLVPAAVASHAIALLLKYLFLALGALCVARAIGFLTVALGHQFGVRFAADSVLALMIAFVFALAIEPFIGLSSQAHEFPIRLQLPLVAGSATALKLQNITRPYMTQLTLVSLLVFFVIQALIYVWCLAKLAEIRRQPLAPRMKLRLLENEDHLFDAGLYVGFAGTVISLVLISMGVVRSPSAMIAYSSTSFGVIFVSVLKIFHIRPLRRKLILDSEATPS